MSLFPAFCLQLDKPCVNSGFHNKQMRAETLSLSPHLFCHSQRARSELITKRKLHDTSRFVFIERRLG